MSSGSDPDNHNLGLVRLHDVLRIVPEGPRAPVRTQLQRVIACRIELYNPLLCDRHPCFIGVAVCDCQTRGLRRTVHQQSADERSTASAWNRSEERRVGKECRAQWRSRDYTVKTDAVA